MYTVFTVDTVFFIHSKSTENITFRSIADNECNGTSKIFHVFFCHIYTLSNTIVGLAEAVVVHEGL